MIHINRSGSSLGIFDEGRVREGLKTGEFIGTDLGWKEGMTAWRPLAELDSFLSTPTAVSPPLIPEGAQPPVTPVSGPATLAARTEPLAIWSLVLSLVGVFCCGFLFSIPAVICGHMALARIKKNPHLQGGGLAMAGLIIGYLGMLFWLIYVVFFGGIAILQGIAEGVGN